MVSPRGSIVVGLGILYTKTDNPAWAEAFAQAFNGSQRVR